MDVSTPTSSGLHAGTSGMLIKPYSKAPARKIKSGRPRGKSHILTDTPENEAIAAIKGKTQDKCPLKKYKLLGK